MFSAAGKSAVTSGYNINNSLRLRSSASAYLSRTPASAGNRRTWTLSMWFKLGALPTADNNLYRSSSDAGANQIWVYFNSSNNNALAFGIRISSVNYQLQIAPIYRDPAAWYHLVYSVDTTQATSSNRAKIYINGEQVTNFITSSYPPQNSDTSTNNTGGHALGSLVGGGGYFDGYMTEVNFVDGSALTPSSFGETDTTTGVWKPKAYTGSYGTNGFYLPFRLNSSSGFSSHYGSFNGTTQSLSATLPSTLSGQFTIEGFIRPNVVTFNPLFTLGDSSTSTGLEFYFGGGSTPSIYSDNGFQISDSYNIPATVWAHIAVTRDASNVIRLFINGTQVGGTWTSTAAFSNTVRIGAEFYSGSITARMNGFISNFRIVTGSALYTSTFTPPSSALTAVSGTQLLTLQNSTIIDNSTNALTVTNTGSVATTSATVGNYISDVGYEYSGNRNTWTTNNINYTSSGTTYDSMTDVPTLTSATVGNYCTANPLDASPSGTSVLSNGNLTVNVSGSSAGGGYGGQARCNTINFTNISGKWYWEAFINNAGTGAATLRLTFFMDDEPVSISSQSGPWAWYWRADGLTDLTGVSSGFATNDVVMFAYDSDSGKLWVGKNGTWLNSGVPASGTGQVKTLTALTAYALGLNYGTSGGGTGTASFNFGQRPFSYTPPTGFNRLNAYNLPDSTIKKGNKYMDATLATGNNSTQVITNAAGFRPDFVWLKIRSASENHIAYDSVRGAQQYLVPNLTLAEATLSSGLTSFNSNGFTLGNANPNYAGSPTFVAWQWQAGSSTVTNTSGSISSQVRVNTTTGFSIVTYTGTGSAATVGHGLGVAPKVVITKKRSDVSDWAFWITGFAGTELMELNGAAAKFTGATVWNSTTPTSTVFSVGSATQTNNSGGTYVAYLWSEIEGFSKFGSYTGNGSTDGPFVYLGFRPKYLMVKCSSSGSTNWTIVDTSRNTFNVTNLSLEANFPDAEQTGTSSTMPTMDLLSNGFKLRTTSIGGNGNGSTYIYMAFAENPFKNALAR